MTDHSMIETELRALLRDCLGLSQQRVDAFDADTGLFGLPAVAAGEETSREQQIVDG